jgi:hypothetical protein
VNGDFNHKFEDFDDNADAFRYPAAPLPPHERPWRHPAEIAASQTVVITPAGTRSKTLAFVVALASMATTVVFAQILRPVERGQESDTRLAAPSSTAPTNPPPAPGVFIVDGTRFAAVAVPLENGRQILVTSRAAASGASVRISDSSSPLLLTAIDEEFDLAVWTSAAEVQTVTSASRSEMTVNDHVTVWDGTTFDGSVGLSMRTVELAETTLVPLDISSKVHAGSPVYDDNGNLIGIVAVKSHSRWLIPIENIGMNVEVISRVNQIINLLGFAPTNHSEGVEVGIALTTDQFQTGDLITHVGSTPINSILALTSAVATVGGGRAIFSVIREGLVREIAVDVPAN